MALLIFLIEFTFLQIESFSFELNEWFCFVAGLTLSYDFWYQMLFAINGNNAMSFSHSVRPKVKLPYKCCVFAATFCLSKWHSFVAESNNVSKNFTTFPDSAAHLIAFLLSTTMNNMNEDRHHKHPTSQQFYLSDCKIHDFIVWFPFYLRYSVVFLFHFHLKWMIFMKFHVQTIHSTCLHICTIDRISSHTIFHVHLAN